MLPDRIDFTTLEDGRTIVQKMRREPAERRDVVTDHDIHLDLDLTAALAWCREHDYTVRTWHGGARAWHGEIWVIRTRAQIKRRREQAERRLAASLHRSKPTTSAIFLDFAYDG